MDVAVDVDPDCDRNANHNRRSAAVDPGFLLLPLAILAAGALQAPPPLTGDLDGQGASETVAAAVAGGNARLEIRDGRGELLASEILPSPGQADPRVRISLGQLGSAGALVEAAVSGARAECRTLWRYREGRLSRVPLLAASGPIPDCAPPEWKYRWERPAENAPALLVRERSRKRSNGVFREVEAYRYAGFRMELEPGRQSSSINGVEIPGWEDAVLYPRGLLDQLASRYDLSPFQTEPRARLVADRARGIFELRFEGAARPRSFPITAALPGKGKRETLLTAGTERARIRVLVSSDGSVPVEAVVQGLEGRLDQVYAPVTHQRETGMRVYESAEQELAEEFFPGTWDDGKKPVIVALASASPPRLRLGQSEVGLSIARAPRGVDALLLPADGSRPTLGVLLRGWNSMLEVPVRCSPAGAGAWPCKPGPPGRTLRRVGARLNVR
jgi:hypothetical protein